VAPDFSLSILISNACFEPARGLSAALDCEVCFSTPGFLSDGAE
jgi:hypothetical protein